MTYRIELAPNAKRDLKKLQGTPAIKRIRNAIDDLATDPRPASVKNLVDEDNLWRVRVSDYRIVYTINDGKLLVLIVRLAHRSESDKD